MSPHHAALVVGDKGLSPRWPYRRAFSAASLAPILVFSGLALATAKCEAASFSVRETAAMRLPLNATTIAWHPDSTVLAAAGWSGMLSV